MSLKVTVNPFAEPVSRAEMKIHLRVDTTADDELVDVLISAAREWSENFQNRSYVAQTFELKMDYFPDVIELPRSPLISVSSIQYVDADGDTQTFDASSYRVDSDSEPARITPAYDDSWPDVRAVTGAVTVTFVAGYADKFTVTTSTNTCTALGSTFTDGDLVRLHNSGGALPVGLSAYTDYYIISVSGNTFQLSTASGGSAVDITEAGVGTDFVGLIPSAIVSALKLLCGHLYENRETVLVGVSANELPMGIKSLLSMDKVFQNADW